MFLLRAQAAAHATPNESGHALTRRCRRRAPAVAVIDTSAAALVNTQVSRCTAYFGGAFLARAASLTLTNATVEDTYAESEGGAAVGFNEAAVAVVGGAYRRCSTDAWGGAFIIDRSNVTITRGALVEYCAGSYGGGALSVRDPRMISIFSICFSLSGA